MGLIAIIGGTGVCDPKILSNVREGTWIPITDPFAIGRGPITIGTSSF